MPLVEDPAHLSKSRLKSDLVAHNVQLPPAASKKEVYVELHLKHIDQGNAADFSSDDEDQAGDLANGHTEDDKKPDPSALTDRDLKALLLKYGVKAGPIVASTRAVYEKKLRKLLQSDRKQELNEAENAVLYSDSDGEEEDEEKHHGEERESEGEQEKAAGALELNEQQHNERPCPHRKNGRSLKWNSKNALKSSATRTRHSQIPAGISNVSSIALLPRLRSGVASGAQSVVSSSCSSLSSQAFSITQMVEEMECRSSPSPCSDKDLNYSNKPEHWSRSSGLERNVEDKNIILDQTMYHTPRDSIKHPQEPMKDILKDIFPDTKTTPTGIYATSRRPIKGAAQRPIRLTYPVYPNTPVSPSTQERREVERRLVPIYIQVLVFFVVVCILYLISVHVEDSSPMVALMESLNQWSDSKEGIPAMDETLDTLSVSGEL